MAARSAPWSDLQGPKLRVGTFKEDAVVLASGANFVLDADPAAGDVHARIPAPSGNSCRRAAAGPRAAARRRQDQASRCSKPRRKRAVTRVRRRRPAFGPQGRQHAQHGAGIFRPDRQGSFRPRSGARCRRRLDRAVLRATPPRMWRKPRRSPAGRAGRDGEDREAPGHRAAWRDHRSVRRPDGGRAGDPRRRACRWKTSPGPAEADDARVAGAPGKGPWWWRPRCWNR